MQISKEVEESLGGEISFKQGPLIWQTATSFMVIIKEKP